MDTGTRADAGCTREASRVSTYRGDPELGCGILSALTLALCLGIVIGWLARELLIP